MNRPLNFVAAYLVIALLMFLFYLQAFLRDRTTPKTDGASWLTLGIGSLFWPIVLPVSLARLVFRRSPPTSKNHTTAPKILTLD